MGTDAEARLVHRMLISTTMQRRSVEATSTTIERRLEKATEKERSADSRCSCCLSVGSLLGFCVRLNAFSKSLRLRRKPIVSTGHQLIFRRA